LERGRKKAEKVEKSCRNAPKTLAYPVGFVV